MQFGSRPLSECLGGLLAHATPPFKKGHRLTEADCALLASAGHDHVIVAALEPGDLHEDDAATRLALALTGSGLRAEAAFTGRVNLFAVDAGLLVLDRAALEELNRRDERLTLATLPPFASVQAGDMVATIKIIPFAVPGALVEQAIAALPVEALRLAPFKPLRPLLLHTLLPGTKLSLAEKAQSVTAARLAALGSVLPPVRTLPHRQDTVAVALKQAVAEGFDPILIMGASAVADQADVIPAGIEQAGGIVHQVGMPVDPGNLLILGQIGAARVLGLPGCARSPKLNGFDWVLQRFAAGIEVRAADLRAMGIGGLLMEIPSRPQPRLPEPEARKAPRLGALLLAAGQSRRMGPDSKLLLPFPEKPMVAVTAEHLRQAGCFAPILVVTGSRQAEVRAVLEASDAGPLTLVEAPDYADGLSRSLIAGIKHALTLPLDGLLIALADMPLVGAEDLRALAEAFDPAAGRAVIVPTVQGQRGNPTLWARDLLPEMLALTGDQGAKRLMDRFPDRLLELPRDNPGLLADLDTPEAYRIALASIRLSSGGTK
ncbi:NTP transferase domain-containing protein [Elstera sp.]|jgi:molybdenum cofactor cytidylyltransferase|uniref:NTP transferase domain-containing protein n=1 Tax=Elstera sp. TaxID=1916664 RepID=UPI0037BF6923